MTDSAIRGDNLSKLYPELSARARHLGAVHQRPDTLRDALTGILPRISQISRIGKKNNPWQAPPSPDNLWALKDVSFEACPAPAGVLRKVQSKGQERRAGGHACASG